MARIRKGKNFDVLVKEHEKEFQEFVFYERKNKPNAYVSNIFVEGEQTILNILGQTKQEGCNSNGFALMFLKNKDVSLKFKEKKLDKFWLDYEKKNFANEKVFYVDTEPVRKIACEKILKTMENYALKNSSSKVDPKSQSCLVFDVGEKGHLVLRGGVAINFTSTHHVASVFVDTKLCEIFSKSKTKTNSEPKQVEEKSF